MICFAMCMAWAAAAGEPNGCVQDLKFQTKGIAGLVRAGARRVSLAADKPAGVTAPPDADRLLWGECAIGPAGKGRRLLLAVDESIADRPRVWVDVNADGDLRNDAPAACEPMRGRGAAGGYGGEFDFHMPWLGDRRATIKFHRFTPEAARQRKLPENLLFLTADYGWTGKLMVDEKAFTLVLADGQVSGLYEFPREHAEGLAIYVDRDGDGRFDGGEERFEPADTINLGGAAFVIDQVSADGRQIKLAAALPGDPKVRRDAGSTDLGKALAFSGEDIDGKPVKFPDDFAGKIVLLDFWATWCGPCREEIPHVVKAHKDFRERGFEVLGVMINERGGREKAREFMKKHDMTWRQIFDGQPIGQQWQVSSIPRMFLIDGDTGRILAAGGDLRGEGAVSKAVEAALKRKSSR